ncbi:hypothetical protein Pcinc_000531 [Petrolisthes cinctipes]|uniref:Uncharacterized protein n=1 Tax=Petrolisthes cinctipes TaxID=88211 RepID=A0AAE1L4S5_PETCI|nr:hypothetical protein Pcinc_000531 [Petrolisthes cinctipes]
MPAKPPPSIAAPALTIPPTSTYSTTALRIHAYNPPTLNLRAPSATRYVQVLHHEPRILLTHTTSTCYTLRSSATTSPRHECHYVSMLRPSLTPTPPRSNFPLTQAPLFIPPLSPIPHSPHPRYLHPTSHLLGLPK